VRHAHAIYLNRQYQIAKLAQAVDVEYIEFQRFEALHCDILYISGIFDNTSTLPNPLPSPLPFNPSQTLSPSPST
jgi:hypothetical protein